MANAYNLTVPPTNIFFVSELPLPELRGTAALASTFLPSMTCWRVYTEGQVVYLWTVQGN